MDLSQEVRKLVKSQGETCVFIQTEESGVNVFINGSRYKIMEALVSLLMENNELGDMITKALDIAQMCKVNKYTEDLISKIEERIKELPNDKKHEIVMNAMKRVDFDSLQSPEDLDRLLIKEIDIALRKENQQLTRSDFKTEDEYIDYLIDSNLKK